MSLGRVEFDIFRELRWKVRLRIDGMHGAYVHTCHAINAILRVNDHLVVHLVEARDRTHLHTVGELTSVTFIRDDVRHGISVVEGCVKRSPLCVKLATRGQSIPALISVLSDARRVMLPSGSEQD